MKILFFILLYLLTPQALAMPPTGFVYLTDIDPSIQFNLRYLSSENFIGHPIAGYKQPRVILTKPAAQALHAVQQDLLEEGYSLVVYDAYRPQKAVDQFVSWAKDLSAMLMKKKYYPRVSKEDIFKLGYLKEKSGHSRGGTVDVSIIPVEKTLLIPGEIRESSRELLDGFKVIFLDDNTVDMGTSFDLFDEASHENSMIVQNHYVKKRDYLKTKMEKHGFKGVKEEWWHFTLQNEPFPNTYFDFDVE